MRSIAKKSLCGLGVFVLILLVAAIALAADNTLNVKCVDPSGKALAGAKVQIYALADPKWTDKDGKPKWKDKLADASGVAKFDKLDDGVYRIVARPEGFAPGLYEFELVALKNGAQESIEIRCAPGDPLTKLYFEDDAMNQKAFETMRQAHAKLQEQKLPEAEQLFKESLEINPSNPDTLLFLGLTYASENKWESARETFQKGLKITDALVALPQPKNPKDPKAAPQPSPYLQANKNFSGMIAMLPGLKLKAEGNDELAKKNYKQAIAKFEESAKLNPGDPDVHSAMAIALGNDNQLEAAGVAIDKAIALRPDDKYYADIKQRIINNAQMSKVKAIADQADAMYNTKDYAGALKKYQETLPMVSEKTILAGVHAQIGQTYDKLKQPDEAEKEFRQAIELAPADARYKAYLVNHFEVLAQEYLTAKQYDQTFDAFGKAGKSIFQLGMDWANKTETADLAIMAFDRVVKAEPVKTEAVFQLGTVYYFGKKDNAKAKEYLAKYLEIGTDEKLKETARNIIAVIDRKK
jgi:tetratricopeptide (TPR) repeat protein